jgi:ELWxxDGT repeat protein
MEDPVRHARSFVALFVAVAAILPVRGVQAQRAALLVDVNTTESDEGESASLTPDALFEVGGKLYFASGTQLWVTDGTATATEPLRVICTRECPSGIQFRARLGGLALMVAGNLLWRSDGTRPGTFALGEFSPAVGGQDLTIVGGRAYFSRCSPQGLCALWRSDGTLAGTQALVPTLRTLQWVVGVGNWIFFEEGDATGSDLWVTDGTIAPILLRHFSASEAPRAPTPAGSRLFFLARKGGEQVWVSDGTAKGTVPVTTFTSEYSLGYQGRLVANGPRVYFVADDSVHGAELWRSDGAPQNTLRITDFAAADAFGYSLENSVAPTSGGRLIFFARDDSGAVKLWGTDGKQGSVQALNLPCSDCTSVELVPSVGRAYFIIDAPVAAPQLWASDGTVAGTAKVRSFCAGCLARDLTPWGDGVLLSIQGFPGMSLWTSDGTEAGTRRYADLGDAIFYRDPPDIVAVGARTFFIAERLGGPDFPVPMVWVREPDGGTRPFWQRDGGRSSSWPDGLRDFGGRIAFEAWDGDRVALGTNSLWLGTSVGASRLDVPTVDWDLASHFVQAGELLYFQVGEPYDPQDLWRTDGTPEGTFVVDHLQGQAVAVAFGAYLYYFDGGWILRSDGTVAGTVKVADYPDDLDGVEAAFAAPHGIFLKGSSGSHGTEFWFTDGTTAGTRITNLDLGGTVGLQPEWAWTGSSLYFDLFDLWRTDGTPAGTHRVSLPGLGPLERPLTQRAVGDALYLFTAGDSTELPLILWRVIGDAAEKLASFPRRWNNSAPPMIAFRGKLYFGIDDGVLGNELWVSDGTSAGTRLAVEIEPGPGSSWPSAFAVAGDSLFFAAGDELHGRELWQSDGTAAGTRLVQDIDPMAPSASPGQLTESGGALFFSADDGIHGREVWSIPLAGRAACQPTSTRLCLASGRYAVEAAWRDFDGRTGSGHAATLGADSGYFWFFDAGNVEVILKVLDGQGVNGHQWVFYGALSNVEYTLTVTDTQTGLARRYVNPSGQFASVGDTIAFGPLGASEKAAASAQKGTPSPPLVGHGATAPSLSCVAGARRLCLGGGRFAVEVAWKAFDGSTGSGQAIEMTGDTGAFWFFGADNVELVLKLLDGRAVNDHFWLFYGALSSVEYSVTVTDTVTGKTNIYRNLAGHMASVADVEAF